MTDEKLTSSLQISVLTALCFDKPQGASIAVQIRPEHFDSIYRDFVTRVLIYRRKYGRPPAAYIDDLATQSSFGKDNSLIKKLLPNLYDEAEGLNGEYIATRVQDFVRRQVLKGALVEAGDRYGQDDENLVGDIEGIFHKALQFRNQTLDAGLRLSDPKGLNFLTEPYEGWPIGIPLLDRLHITPAPKELLLYIAPKNSGKSWFCVHVGRHCLMQRLKVLHISLEMDELKVLRRYYQNLFSIARLPNRYTRTTLEFDELERLSGFKPKLVKPKLDLTNPKIRKILHDKIAPWGTRLDRLIVKAFPTGSFTISQLESYLDYLESVQKFVPNVLIVDYPKLMSQDRRSDLRISIGRNMEDLRGIGGKRNMAIVAPHQGTRATIGARRVRSKDAGEDISVVQTADNVLSYSATPAEARLGLGRLGVEHARDAESGAVVLLSQAYHIGQYVLHSASIQQAYWDHLKDISGEDEDKENEDE